MELREMRVAYARIFIATPTCVAPPEPRISRGTTRAIDMCKTPSHFRRRLFSKAGNIVFMPSAGTSTSLEIQSRSVLHCRGCFRSLYKLRLERGTPTKRHYLWISFKSIELRDRFLIARISISPVARAGTLPCRRRLSSVTRANPRPTSYNT